MQFKKKTDEGRQQKRLSYVKHYNNIEFKKSIVYLLEIGSYFLGY